MILIVDRTPKKQNLIKETIQEHFPGYKTFHLDTGAYPFEILKQLATIQLVIICEPITSYSEKNQHRLKQSEHAVEWIESLRHGSLWDSTDSNLPGDRKIVIQPKTKDQLPILYIHPYNNLTEEQHYPQSFPSHFLIQKSTLLKAKKFTKKWYKSIGANEIVFYPWGQTGPDEFKQAFLNCINKRNWFHDY